MLGAIPYAVAFLAMLVNGWHSDRSCERALAFRERPCFCFSLFFWHGRTREVDFVVECRRTAGVF